MGTEVTAKIGKYDEEHKIFHDQKHYGNMTHSSSNQATMIHDDFQNIEIETRLQPMSRDS